MPLTGLVGLPIASGEQTRFGCGLGGAEPTLLSIAALRAMASAPSAYHHAPSGEALAAIYRAIAVDLPCPAAAFWGGR